MTVCLPNPALDAAARESRKMRKHLVDLTNVVRAHIDALDLLMKMPSTPERGKTVAALCNHLEMANDKARYFGLGVDYRRDRKRRARAPAADGETASPAKEG